LQKTAKRKKNHPLGENSPNLVTLTKGCLFASASEKVFFCNLSWLRRGTLSSLTKGFLRIGFKEQKENEHTYSLQANYPHANGRLHNTKQYKNLK
jgi:hypothetical protein